jgi:O-antigen/teichoic acid export membrane protein
MKSIQFFWHSSLLHRLGKKVFLVLGASFFSRLVPYLCLPLIANNLSLTDMGIMGYLGSILMVATLIIGLQPQLFFNVHIATLTRLEVSQYTNCFMLVALSLSLVSYGIGKWLIVSENQWISTDIDVNYLAPLLIIIFATIITSYTFVTLQYENRYAMLFIISLSGVSIHYILGLVLVEGYPSWRSMLIAQFTGAMVVLGICYNQVRQKVLSFDFCFSQFKNYLYFCLPLIIHGVALALMVSADKILISEMLGLKEAGLYSVVYTVGFVVAIFHDALSRIWSPFFYRRISSGIASDHSEIRRATILYSLMSLLVLVSFFCFAGFLFEMFFDSRYHSSFSVALIVASAYTVEAGRKLSVAYLLEAKRVLMVSLSSLIAAVANILANFYAIPIYGIKGAAWTTLFSYILATAVTVSMCFIMSENFRTVFLKKHDG